MITFSTISHTRNLFRRTTHSLYHTLEPSIPLLNLVEHSIETHSLELTHQSHATAHRLGLTDHPIIAQKLIFAYCHFKCLTEARRVFDLLPVKNSHVCNALLSGYGRSRLLEESLKLFKWMCEGSSVSLTDEFSFSAVFKILGDSGELLSGEMVHGRGLKTGLASDAVVGNSLLSMYGRCEQFEDCLKVFDEMPVRTASSWNAAISLHAKTGLVLLPNFGFSGFVNAMADEGLKIDAFTVSTLISLLPGDSQNCEKQSHGRELHCYIIKNEMNFNRGSHNDLHIGCCLIDMYCKNGRAHVGRRVFDRMTQRNVFVWTAMINSCTNSKNFHEALLLFRDMQENDRIVPNKVSLVSILPACTDFISGKQIHGFAVRQEINHETSLCNALIDTYSKSGSLTYASRVFHHECTHKDSISWSSMISGFSLHGHGEKAIRAFDEMLEKGSLKPDPTVVVCVLSACCRSGLVNEGMRIYESAVNEHGIDPTVEMCSCVVDMLSKSGRLDRALEFVRTAPFEPGPSVWGALMSASGQHGSLEMQELAHEALMKIEPGNSSNYVSLSNLYASSKRWEEVAELRRKMKERGLRKMPGFSWITLGDRTHSFFVGDKKHPRSELIYLMLEELVATMKLAGFSPDFVYLVE